MEITSCHMGKYITASMDSPAPTLPLADDDNHSWTKMAEQTQKTMASCELENAVLDIVKRCCLGMPVPLDDGSLSTADGSWRSVDSKNYCCVQSIPLANAGNRARQHTENGAWTPGAKVKAMQEFLVSGTVVFFVPEVFCRDSLMQDERHQVKDGLDRPIGVRLACPSCESNEYTLSEPSWAKVRVVHTLSGTNLFVSSHGHRCYNPRCPGVKEGIQDIIKDKADATFPRVDDGTGHERELSEGERQCMRRGLLSTVAPSVLKTLLNGGRSFSISERGYMEHMPDTVRKQYTFDLYQQGGADDALLDKTVSGRQSSSALHRDVVQMYNQREHQRYVAYSLFSKAEGGSWPEWRSIPRVRTLLSPPSEKAMEGYCNQKFEQIRPRLLDELCSRSAGRSLSLGTSLKIASQYGGEAKCVVFALGESGHILAYAVLASTKWSHLLPMLFGLSKRFERMGKEGDLEMISMGTCCDGLDNPEDHVVTKIFPNVRRAPYADSIDRTRILTTAVDTAHPLFAEYSREIASASTERWEKDMVSGALSLVNSGMTGAKAVGMTSSASYAKHVRTRRPPNLAEKLIGIRDKYQRLSEGCVVREDRAFFRERKGLLPSTLETFDSVLKCAKKGCMDASRGVKDACSVDRIDPETGLATVHSGEGAGDNESAHREHITRVVAKAESFCVGWSERELALFVFHHNHEIDILRGICKPGFSRKGERYWGEERLEELRANIDGPCSGGKSLAGRKLPKEHDEHMGQTYLAAFQNAEREERARHFGVDIRDLSPPCAVEGAEEGARESSGGGAPEDAWRVSDLGEPSSDSYVDPVCARVGDRAGEEGEAGDAGCAGGFSGPLTERGGAPQPTQAVKGTGASRGVADGGRLKRSYSDSLGPKKPAVVSPAISKTPRATKRDVVVDKKSSGIFDVVMIETPDEIELAICCMAEARSKSAPERAVWQKAAALYNKGVLRHLVSCPGGKGRVKQYHGLTTDEMIQAFFAKKLEHVDRPAVPVHGVREGGDPRPAPQVVSRGAGMQRRHLTDAEIATMGRNKCRDAIRLRGGSCANSANLDQLRLKLQQLVRKNAQ